MTTLSKESNCTLWLECDQNTSFHNSINSFLYKFNSVRKDYVYELYLDREELEYVFEYINRIEDLPHFYITSKSTDVIDFFDFDNIVIGKDKKTPQEFTGKQLRKVHNIRKMYIAGAFNGERK